MKKEGACPKIGEILCEMKVLSEDQVSALLHEQQKEEKNTPGPSKKIEAVKKRSRFGQMAVNRGYTDQLTIYKALKLQRKISQEKGEWKKLGEILVEKGILSEETRDAILFSQNGNISGQTELTDIRKDLFRETRRLETERNCHENRMLKGSETIGKSKPIGEIAVEYGFATDDDIDQVLTEQRELNLENKSKLRVGELLEIKGIITQAQKDYLLAVQQNEILQNPDFDTHDNVSYGDRKNMIKLPGFDMAISDDNMEVHIRKTESAHEDVTIEDLKEYLEVMGIVHGIIPDEQILEYLDAQSFQTSLKIAVGTLPVPGKTGKFIHHFLSKKEDTYIGKGFGFQGEYPPIEVHKGDLILELGPASDGIAGMNVFGETIFPEETVKDRIIAGKGVILSDDQSKAFAGIDGVPVLDEDGTLHVQEILRLEGDIDRETGDVAFEGHIDLKGIVQSGFRVRAHGLHARGILGAEIDISGNLFVDGGIYGATIVARNVHAGHIHKSRIRIYGDITVEKEVFETHIEAGGRCVAPEGKFISSEVNAQRGIIVNNVGSAVSRPCTLIVGMDSKRKKQIRDLRSEILSCEKELDVTEGIINNMTEELRDHLEKMKKAAREKEKCKIQEDIFLQKATELENREQKKLAEQLKDAIEKNIQKRKKFEIMVAENEKQSNRIRKEIQNQEQQAAKKNEKIVELKNLLNQLTEPSQDGPNSFIIQVTGTICANTLIKGPHSKLVTRVDYQSVKIRETFADQGEKENKWRLQIESMDEESNV